jgi:signal peptidase I
MFFLTPRHIKQGRQFARDARKLLHYRRDLATPETIAEVEQAIGTLETAVKTKDKARIEERAMALDKVCGKLTKPQADMWIRENVEMFLVAIVIALGVRTYFLQPFTIPTGSMYPALNGIILHRTNEPPPNFLVRGLQVAVFGRHYVDFVAEESERIAGVQPVRSPLPFIGKVPRFGGGLFQRTEIVTEAASGRRRRYLIKQAPDTVQSQFPEVADRSRVYQPGEPILRGYFDAGDHVFVDKMSFHFRKPRRGETIVFSTAKIAQIKARSATSQYYIKRLAGVPGDALQIRSPELFVNGQRAQERQFLAVMSGTREQDHRGFRGYGNFVEQRGYDQQVWAQRLTYLADPEETFSVPEGQYFALGDNSYNSWDSRGWGTVPEESLMGRELLIYWPFWPHFGLAK